MISQATVDMLKGMKMSAMAAELERQLTDASYRELGFEERLGLLVTAEWNRRQTNKVNRSFEMLISLHLLLLWNRLNTMKTANWTNLRYYVSPPVSTLRKVTILF